MLKVEDKKSNYHLLKFVSYLYRLTYHRLRISGFVHMFRCFGFSIYCGPSCALIRTNGISTDLSGYTRSIDIIFVSWRDVNPLNGRVPASHWLILPPVMLSSTWYCHDLTLILTDTSLAGFSWRVSVFSRHRCCTPRSQFCHSRMCSVPLKGKTDNYYLILNCYLLLS